MRKTFICRITEAVFHLYQIFESNLFFFCCEEFFLKLWLLKKYQTGTVIGALMSADKVKNGGENSPLADKAGPRGLRLPQTRLKASAEVTSRWLLLVDKTSALFRFSVFGEETGLRHAVVWVFADHGGADPAVWGPHVWKVNPYFCFHPANSSEPTLRLPFLGFPGRFGDLFGARAALSVACASTVLFFLLLAVADHPAMLFIHKLPTLFMHVIPGERLMESQFKAQN